MVPCVTWLTYVSNIFVASIRIFFSLFFALYFCLQNFGYLDIKSHGIANILDKHSLHENTLRHIQHLGNNLGHPLDIIMIDIHPEPLTQSIGRQMRPRTPIIFHTMDKRIDNTIHSTVGIVGVRTAVCLAACVFCYQLG